MKVIAIRLQNFMGFTDTKWVELRPLTLIYGWNSTGKSALIRALLLLRQSIAPAQNFVDPLVFVSDGGIDLGNFRRMIHGRTLYDDPPEQAKDNGSDDEYKVRRQMSFGFRCEVDTELAERLNVWEIAVDEIEETYLDLTLSYQFNEQAVKNKVELSAITLEASCDRTGDKNGRREILEAEYLDIEGRRSWYLSSYWFSPKNIYYPSDEKKAETNPDDTSVVLYPNLEFASENGFFPTLSAKRDKGKSETTEAESSRSFVRGKTFEKIERLYNYCRDSIKDFFSEEKFRYLGPIRSAPRRTYLLSDLSQHKWDASGQAAIRDFLNSYRDKDKESATRAAWQDELDAWLHALGIGQELHVKRLKLDDAHDDLFTEAFQLEINEGSGSDVNVRDVGYGASQVLPILLQVFSAPDDCTVIVEQPELHMHSEAQAVLADFLVSQSKNRRFLVETHSENIRLRLQLRGVNGIPRYLPSIEKELNTNSSLIKRERKIDKSQVQFLFVTRNADSGVSTVNPVNIGAEGLLDEPPASFASFFSRDLLDSSVITIANEKLHGAKAEVKK